MSPRGKKSELPKPVIRPKTLGCFPLNGFTVSYLAEGCGDIILGFCDAPETLVYKSKPSITVKKGKSSREHSLENRFFNGYADALYRGRLPEVILAAPSFDALPEFLEDFAGYLEKLLSLGFFVQNKEIIKKDPVSELIPCFLLTGSGLLFSRFITGLVRYLQHLEKRYPILDAKTRTHIISRFVRALPCSDRPDRAPIVGEEALLVTGSTAFELLPVPRHFRIAGGSRNTLDIIQSTLQAQGLTATVEDRVRNPVERLEFENALWHLSRVIIPTLAQSDALSDEVVKRAEAGIMAIGRKREAFQETDNPESILGQPVKRAAKSFSSQPEQRQANRQNSGLLSDLSHYAEVLGLRDEQQVFEQLAARMVGNETS
jgi:hypothetical protein